MEAESFMDLIAANAKEESGQHVHDCENMIPAEEETELENN